MIHPVKKNPVNVSRAMAELDILFRPHSYDILYRVHERPGMTKKEIMEFLGCPTTVRKRVDELISFGLMQYRKDPERYGSVNWELYVSDIGLDVLLHMKSIYRDIYKSTEIPLELTE